MSGANVNPANDPDPLLHLHKMSTTAGVGSTEYVAVNTTAVVAALFGVASILAFLGYVLLVIPLVGVVLSLVALKQIRQSNQTQTGRAVAWLGLVLSAAITAAIFVQQGIGYFHRHDDKVAIGVLCDQYGKDVAGGHFDDAYKLFDAVFKQRIPLDEFKARLESMQINTRGAPTITSMSSAGYVEFHSTDTVETASAYMILRFNTGQEAREPSRFRKDGGVWLIDELENTFPPEKKGRGSR